MIKFFLILGGAILLLPIILLSETIPYQEGWPVFVNGALTSPIKIADIDNDGEKEVIYGDGSFVGQSDWWMYVKRPDGTDENGWPINYAGTSNPSAIFDYNEDGFLEIILAAGGLFLRSHEGDLIWEIPYNGPIFQNKYIAYHVSIDDLDNDGIKEIVVTTYSGAVEGGVFVFEPDGSLRDGWPVLSPNANGTNCSASIGDIDKDGLKEIIVTSDKIYCFKPDGSNCPGFPFGGEMKWRSSFKPLLIDYNNDGYLEIIYSNKNALPPMIIMLDYQGNIIPPYPLELPNGAYYINASDLNLDGRLEFLISRYMGFIDAYDIETAEILPNFPMTDPTGEFAVGEQLLLDLSDYYGKEILATGATGGFVPDAKLFAFQLNGEIVLGFPSERFYGRTLRPCAVDDLDGDGDVEICCGAQNETSEIITHTEVYCWDSPHPWNRDMADWMMDGFDLQNTGRWRKLYHIDKINSHLEFEGCTENPCILPNDGNLHPVTITAKRKFAEGYPEGQDVRLSRTEGCGEYEGPVYDNGDGTYTRFFRAPTNECQTKIEGWVNEFKLEESLNIYFGPDFGFCDGNTTRCEVTDVQRAVNQNLGMRACSLCADCEPDGLCSITDVQKIVNCNLGLQVNCH